jgi:hypothetical protein
LHPKFYSPIFFWDVESSSNYAKKLKLTGIAATTLLQLKACHTAIEETRKCLPYPQYTQSWNRTSQRHPVRAHCREPHHRHRRGDIILAASRPRNPGCAFSQPHLAWAVSVSCSLRRLRGLCTWLPGRPSQSLPCNPGLLCDGTSSGG